MPTSLHVSQKTALQAYNVTLATLLDATSKIKTNNPTSDRHWANVTAQIEVIAPNPLDNIIKYTGSSFVSVAAKSALLLEDDSLLEEELVHYSSLINKLDLDSLIDCLRQNPSSKKSYYTFWKNNFIGGQTGTIPCAIGFHVVNRDGKLDFVMNMRANNVNKLLYIDMCIGIALQAYIAKCLLLQPGHYYHQVSSLHIYKSELDSIRYYVKNL